ncbi:hypothetical protein AeNC1_019222, partial [Aphanomyces euteiches]
RNVFLFLLHKLLMITPVAVVFLMASAIGSMGSENVGEVMSNIGFFFLAFMTGVLVHSFLVLPLVLYLWTRANPYAYIKHLFPAYVFAYGCSSSMGTLPVAMACIQNAHVSRALIHMTMPYGTATNLNACGIYFPLALVFMANMSGLGDELTLLGTSLSSLQVSLAARGRRQCRMRRWCIASRCGAHAFRRFHCRRPLPTSPRRTLSLAAFVPW